jgi:hypothetical protein
MRYAIAFVLALASTAGAQPPVTFNDALVGRVRSELTGEVFRFSAEDRPAGISVCIYARRSDDGTRPLVYGCPRRCMSFPQYGVEVDRDAAGQMAATIPSDTPLGQAVGAALLVLAEARPCTTQLCTDRLTGEAYPCGCPEFACDVLP